MRIGTFLLTIWMAALAPDAHAEPRPDIAKIEAQLGCQDHRVDEPEGPMVLDFRYPHENASKPPATVFWCARDNLKAPLKSDFLLVFIRDGKLYHPSCQPYLTVRSFTPFGIALSDQPEGLKGFYFLDELENGVKPVHGPQSGQTTGPVFKSGTSVETSFYCLHGRWVYQMRD